MLSWSKALITLQVILDLDSYFQQKIYGTFR